MIRNSFFSTELARLQAFAGADHAVRVAARHDLVWLGSFSFPWGKRLYRTPLVIEIPDGYGFGAEIGNCWVQLPGSGKRHLLPDAGIPAEIEKRLGFRPKRHFPRRHWYWLCLALWGTRRYDETTGTDSLRLRRDLPVGEGAADSLGGLVDFVRIAALVLGGLYHGDGSLAAEARRAREQKDAILAMLDEESRAVVDAHAWRCLPWVYR
jgi:hypothetical protein